MKRKLTKKTGKKVSDHEMQEALAVLIRNTRTTSRYLSLVEIEKWLKIAIRGVGSLKEVAERIDLSTKMLRQFQYIGKLSKPVRNLFASRKIDSVDAAVHLSKLSSADQLSVARELASGAIDTADVRAIYDFSKRNPRMLISEVIENIKATRNIKQYVAEFVIREDASDLACLKKRFCKALGEKDVLSLDVKGSIGKITLTASGKKNLERLSLKKDMTKMRLVTLIVQGDIR